MSKKILFPLVFLLVICNGMVLASASEDQGKTDTKNDGADPFAYTLSPITVIDKKDGDIILNKATLELMPNTTQSITEALRGSSSVQFDSMFLDTFTGGAITPPKISIRGAHHYENNFTINGMGNNSVLNPRGFSETEGFGAFLPSGDSQAMFINTDLIESVTAHTENISAAYGSFLGGVVDAKYRNAAKDRWRVSLSTKHTRDAWLRQHYIEGNEPRDYPRSKDGQHTRFKKNDLSAIIEGPVSDNSGLVLAYARKWSRIPTYVDLQEPEKTMDRRVNENLFFRLNSSLFNNFTAAVNATFAPYRSKMHPPSQKGGEYEVQGGGYNVTLETEWTLPWGSWENNLAFNHTELSKFSNSDVLYQWLSTPNGYANWSSEKYAREGMVGDQESSQKDYELKSHFRFREHRVSLFRHQLVTGLDLKHLKAESKTDGFTSYIRPKKSNLVVGELADGVVSGEQYTSRKNVGSKNSRSKKYDTAALFLEDRIEMKRLLVRPGLRVSWDSITKNWDFAPRFFMDYDVLNTKKVKLFGGYNRYYGGQVLYRAIKMPPKYSKYKRSVVDGVLQDWMLDKETHRNADQLGDLKTPFVDEYNAGVSAVFLDTVFDLTYVNRGYRDQIRIFYDDVKKNRTVTNGGKTDYWGVTLNVRKEFDLGRWGQHNFQLGVTRSSSESNYAKWANAFDESDAIDDSSYVELNGAFVKRDELPVGNFAAPWVITYTHEMRFWDGRLRLMPTVRYETGGETLSRLSKPSSVTGPDGKDADRYLIADRHNIINMDLAAAFDVIRYNDNILSLEMDVTNVFDRKNKINTDPDKSSYARGRQFYMGMKYKF